MSGISVFRKRDQFCISGIEETNFESQQSQIQKRLPTSAQLRKYRRIATKTRASVACTSCKQDKRRCGDSRPCPRCVATGQEKICIITTDTTEIEFPLPFSMNFMSFANDAKVFPDALHKHHWSYQMVRAFFSTGYKFSAMNKIFQAIPNEMACALEQLAASMEQLKLKNSLLAKGHVDKSF